MTIRRQKVLKLEIVRTETGLTWIRWCRTKDAVEHEMAVRLMRQIAAWKWP